MFCGRGGTGRRAGFRFLWATVGVQIPSSAPKEKSRNLSKDKCDFFVICGLESKNKAELTHIFR